MFGFFPKKAGKRRTLEHQKSNTATARTGWLILLEAAIGIEPMNKGFAGLAVNFFPVCPSRFEYYLV